MKVTQQLARERVVLPEDMVSCNLAFVDCKLPGSNLKQNYSFIGPGVSQSREQVVNIPTAHGFNIGAAAMPKGVTNNLHLHFTAEVFLIHEGRWRFRWGAQGEHEAEFEAPAILTIPTWIFRGFTNASPQETDGWVFTILGGDNTGGIIWHPQVLQAAREYGMYLSRDNMLIDTANGDVLLPEDQLMPMLGADELAKLADYSVAEMAKFAVTGEQRQWSKHALLDSMLEGHGGELAPVIGYGMSADRTAVPAVTRPHGFSVEWLKLAAGAQLGTHRCEQVQVLMVFKGDLTITYNQDGEEVQVKATDKSVVSVPADSWRRYQAGDQPCEVVVVTQGDGRARVHWSDDIIAAAEQQGWGLDPDGYLAPLAVMPGSAQRAGKARAS